MPPYVSRKHSRSPEPAAQASSTPLPRNRNSGSRSKHPKSTIFDAVDAPRSRPTGEEETHNFLERIGGDDDGEDIDSDRSEYESDEFEDVPPAKRAKATAGTQNESERDEKGEEEDDEMEWEDAMQESPSKDPVANAGPDICDVSISMREDGTYIEPLVNAATGKKGPSKRERQARVQTHCLHVQALLWHNTVRNSWLNDAGVQEILRDALPEGMKAEVRRWRRSMGLLSREDLEAEKAAAAAEKSKSKGKSRRGNAKADLKGRDWSYSAEHAEQGVVDLSHGDPMLRLLKLLTAYWRKRFTVTAPGLRKSGYMPLRRLREVVKGWDADRQDESHGERIDNLAAFRQLAKNCEGSRDVGAQLFVSLLRSIGLEVRVVANLQPAGFGWSKSEEANPKKGSTGKDHFENSESKVPKKPSKLPPPQLRNALTPKQSRKEPERQKPVRNSSRGDQSRPINLEDSDSSLSSIPSDLEGANGDEHGGVCTDDDLSVVDVTPASRKRSTKKYDRDLPHPIYWAEVLSPVSHKYIPVDPIVLSTIASSEELLQSFEPRGSRADRAKQVMCYTIGFNADGTAKDVTVRYLKRHQLPGKTKGVRMPVEKLPIYNRHGKVKRYEEQDWFRGLMRMYDRPEAKRTEADDLEDETDLKPFKPSKGEKVEEKESLAWYKASAEFVLEPHLRREEALLPKAKPVKTFTAGKGDKAKEYLVYRRKDVASCKTVESWHKEGRGLKPGAQPLKYVPMRAVTLQRKREIEDAQRETGEKMKQGLYSKAQTDWIIPPPIERGVIPKNVFGNMDVYVPTMVPQGAVHLPLRGCAKICKRLGIDFAEACTGFEFGKQRAVPVLSGVVVAEENEAVVRDAWRAEQVEAKRKEDTKRTAAALHWWRKMLMGRRIIERMKIDYANSSSKEEEINPFVRRAEREDRHAKVRSPEDEDAQMGGGFIPEGSDQERDQAPLDDADREGKVTGGGFLVDDGSDDDGGHSLVRDLDHRSSARPKDYAPFTPISLQSIHKGAAVQGGDGVDGRKKSGRNLDACDPSSGSDLSDLESDDDDEPNQASPRVVIPPKRSNKSGGRAHKQRATSVRSPYFNSSDPSEKDSGQDDDEMGSDQEVVSVRKTTARTRARK